MAHQTFGVKVSEGTYVMLTNIRLKMEEAQRRRVTADEVIRLGLANIEEEDLNDPGLDAVLRHFHGELVEGEA